MPIKFPDSLTHNNPAMPIVSDSDMRGGYVAVADIAARSAIPLDKRKQGMAVNCLDGTARVTAHYLSADLSNAAWTNAANWRTISSHVSQGNVLLGRETGAGQAQELAIGAGLALAGGVLTAAGSGPGGDLTTGPVRSSGGESSIAPNALSMTMTSGLQDALDLKLELPQIDGIGVNSDPNSVPAEGELVGDGGTNVLDGETITIGSTVFTFKNAPVGPFQIQIGADLGESLANAGVTMTATEGIDAANFDLNILTVYAQYSGSPIPLSTTSAALTASGPTLTGGSVDPVAAQYTGQLAWSEVTGKEYIYVGSGWKEIVSAEGLQSALDAQAAPSAADIAAAISTDPAAVRAAANVASAPAVISEISLTSESAGLLEVELENAITSIGINHGENPRDLKLLLRQDATGNRLATFGGSILWDGGVAPTLKTAPFSWDLLEFCPLPDQLGSIGRLVATYDSGAPSPVVLDNFNRADGALGTASNGVTWTVTGGAWSVVSNKAKSNNAGISFLTIPSGIVAGNYAVDFDLVLSGTYNIGIVYRAETGANCCLFLVNSAAPTSMQFWRRATGDVWTNRYSMTSTALPGDGVSRHLRLEVTSDVIGFFVDGALIANYKINAADVTAIGAFYNVGLYSNGLCSGCTIDNLEIKPV